MESVSLTFNFSSTEEAQAFLASATGKAAPTLTTPKKKVTKKNTAAAEPAQETGPVIAPQPVQQAPAQQAPQQQSVPAQQTAPTLTGQQREAFISNIKGATEELTARGVSPEEQGQLFADIYTQLGIPMGKVSELNDADLFRFFEAFRDIWSARYQGPQTQAAPAQANSYI